VEFKVSAAAKPKRGFWTALQDLDIKRAWIVSPIEESYPLHGAQVSSIQDFIESPENNDIFL